MDLKNKKILIETTPGIGDAIMTTPTLRALKEYEPTIELTILSHRNNLEVLRGLPYIDHCVKIGRKSWREKLETLRALARQDIVIFTTWQSLLYARAAKIMRVPYRAGVIKDKYRNRKFVHTELPGLESYGTMYRPLAVQAQIELALGIHLNVNPVLEVANPGKEIVSALEEKLQKLKIRKKEYAVCAPFGNTAKDIPEHLVKRFCKIMQRDYRLSVIFTHHISVADYLERNSLHKPGIHDLSARISLSEFIALFDGARLVFSTDSGPMHIAAARGIPTIGYFSTDLPERWARNPVMPLREMPDNTEAERQLEDFVRLIVR